MTDSTKSVRGAERYTPEQQDAWCKLAVEHGVPFAIKACGYPGSYRTAYIWLEARGMEAPKTTLAIAATVVKSWYTDFERRLVAQEVLDNAHELLLRGTVGYDGKSQGLVRKGPLEPKELQSVAATVRSAINVLQMLDGKATEIIQQNTTLQTTPEIIEALEAAKAKNEASIAKLKVA